MKRRGFFGLVGASLVAGCFGGSQETDGPGSDHSPTSTPSTAPGSTEPANASAGTGGSTPSDTTANRETARTGNRTATPGDTLSPPTMGDPAADVTVVVFEDYACPHCRDFSLNVVPKLRADYVDPGSVLYEHRDFPLPVNRWSRPAANAARAVQDIAGDSSFFEYCRALYENQSRYSFDLLLALGDEVGVDGAEVRTAAEERRYESVIQSDTALGNEMGVRGTPEVYVNGVRTENPAYETLRGTIESEL